MAGEGVGAESRPLPGLPLGSECEAAQRDSIAANRREVLDELMDAGDPAVPPTDDEILGLILGEVMFIQRKRPLPNPESRKTAVPGRSKI